MKKFSRDEPIETEAEHEAALKRIDQLMDATEGSPEAEELSDLADAVCLYENEHFSLDDPSWMPSCTCFEIVGEDPWCKLHGDLRKEGRPTAEAPEA